MYIPKIEVRTKDAEVRELADVLSLAVFTGNNDRLTLQKYDDNGVQVRSDMSVLLSMGLAVNNLVLYPNLNYYDLAQ